MSRRFLVLLTAGAVLALAAAGSLLGLRWTGRHRLADARARFETRFGPIDAPRALHPGALAPVEMTVEDRARIFELASGLDPGWTSADVERVRGLMSRTAVLASDAPGQRSGAVAGDPTPERMAGQLQAARFLSLVARMNPRGEPGDAIDAVAALGRLSRSLRDDASVRVFSISLYVEALQLAAVRARVGNEGAGPDQLTRLRAALVDDDLPDAWRRTYALDVAVGGSTSIDELRDMTTAPIWERVWYGSTADLALADLLDMTVGMADALAVPYPEVRDAIAVQAHRSSTWAGSMGPVAIPNLIELSGRVAAVDTLRHEARVALELRLRAARDGFYPDSLDGIAGADRDSRLTGGTLRYVRGDGGGAVLDLPGAAEALGPWPMAFAGLLPDLFTWELPAAGRLGPVSTGIPSGAAPT